MLESLLNGFLGKDFEKIHNKVKQVLSQYSPEEINEIIENGGMEQIFHQTAEQIIGKSLIKEDKKMPDVEELKTQLRKNNYYKRLSDEVEEYFIDKKAKLIIRNGFSFQHSEDDRLGENLDNALANFRFDSAIELPFSKNEAAERLQTELKKPENKIVGEFLMRQTPEHLKLLIYYSKVSSFEDLKYLFDTFEEQKNEIDQYSGSRMGHMSQHPVEFMDAIGGARLENIFRRTKVSSVTDFKELLLDSPYMGPLIAEVHPNILDYIMDVAKVGSVDDMVKLIGDEEFRQALANVDSSGAYPNNLVTAMDYFKIDDVQGMQELIDLQKTRIIMQKASQPNFKTLMRISEVETASDLERLCNNAAVSQNIGEADYSHLNDLLADLGVEPEQRDSYMYEVVTHSYNKRTAEQAERLSSLLGQKIAIPDNLNEFIITLLHDEDYIEQNLDSVIQLMQNDFITTEALVESLAELKDIMGGFVTPELSRKYLQTEDKTARTEVLKSYRTMMAQVLGSSKIEIADKDMASEIIYLAYRPTGYSINHIKAMISDDWNSLEDLTHHLDNIKFNRDGYVMKFNFVAREQTEEYDSKTLRKIDTPIVSTVSESGLKDLLFQALSGKPKHQDALPNLFGQVLEIMEDDRVNAYRENYHSGKGVSQEYTEQRIESLSEIFSIMPKEDAFYENLSQLIQSDDDLKAVVQNSADRYQWKRNKRHFSGEERACKNRLDEAIKHLERHPDSDVSGLLSTGEFAVLGKDEITKLNKADNGKLYEQLTDIRAKKFLGYGSGTETAVDVFYQALLQYTKNGSGFVKREMKKVKAVKSDEIAEVKAVVSKNVGSYFAKAGAEICTSHNTGMWNEERHSHLNLVYKDQIIGNVMLYFEPERDYMVARGFNPRKDTMMQFDRYSMAAQIVRVLEQIAKANGYSEVFIPEQTGWHALSNRDGMVKEIEGLSRKTMNRVNKNNPGQITYIENAEFYVTQIGDTAINRLNLLSLVQ